MILKLKKHIYLIMKKLFFIAISFICVSGSISAQKGQLSKAGYENFIKAGIIIEQAGEIKEIKNQEAKFLEAIALLEQITLSDPNAADIYFNLSVLYKNLGLTATNANYLVKSADNLKIYMQLSPTTDKRGIEQKIAVEMAVNEVWKKYETYYSSLMIPNKENGETDLKAAQKRNMYQDAEFEAIIKKAERVKKRGWDIPLLFVVIPGSASLGAGIGLYFYKDYDTEEYTQRELSKKLIVGGVCAIGIGIIFETLGMHSYKKVLKKEIPLYNKKLQDNLNNTKKIKPIFSMGVTGSGGIGLSLTF